MLKIATLSLAALLALASPSFAENTTIAPPKAECIAPIKFGEATRIEGADLIQFREIAKGLPEQVDLVLILKAVPVAITFVKGCAVGVGHLIPRAVPSKPEGEAI
jgi:hypothetical protein